MRRYTGEGKVDYTWGNFWESLLAEWEKPQFPPRGTYGVIRFYNFDIDSAELKPGHRTGFAWLGEFALKTSIQENNDLIFVIGGHSNTGDKDYNLKLARNRSENVANFLVEHGVPRERLDILAAGMTNKDSKGELERFRAVTVLFTAWLRTD